MEKDPEYNEVHKRYEEWIEKYPEIKQTNLAQDIKRSDATISRWVNGGFHSKAVTLLIKQWLDEKENQSVVGDSDVIVPERAKSDEQIIPGASDSALDIEKLNTTDLDHRIEYGPSTPCTSPITEIIPFDVFLEQEQQSRQSMPYQRKPMYILQKSNSDISLFQEPNVCTANASLTDMADRFSERMFPEATSILLRGLKNSGRCGYVYIMKNGHRDEYKIGYTMDTGEKRLKALNTGNPDLYVEAEFRCKYPKTIESCSQFLLAQYRITDTAGREFYMCSFTNACFAILKSIQMMEDLVLTTYCV